MGDLDVFEIERVIRDTLKGGVGSGNFGHSGIPGHHGGSRSGSSVSASMSDDEKKLIDYWTDNDKVMTDPGDAFGASIFIGRDGKAFGPFETHILEANDVFENVDFSSESRPSNRRGSIESIIALGFLRAGIDDWNTTPRVFVQGSNPTDRQKSYIRKMLKVDPNADMSFHLDGVHGFSVDEYRRYLRTTTKGGRGSGNFGHSGIRGHHGGSAPRTGASAFVSKPLRVSNSIHMREVDNVPVNNTVFEKKYMILSSGNLPDDTFVGVGENNMGHDGIGFDIIEQNMRTLAKDDPELMEKLENMGGANRVEWLIRKAGCIRIAQMRGETDIQTRTVDNETLRRLQELSDNGKLELDKQVAWSGSDARSVILSKERFLSGNYVVKYGIYDGLTIKGGQGSGNFGHSGIPGHHGGSAPRSGISASYQDFGGRTGKARAWGDSFYAANEHLMGENQLQAMDGWTHEKKICKAIGVILRKHSQKGIEELTTARLHAHVLSALLEKARTPSDIIAYRGIKNQGNVVEGLKNLKPGDEITDKNFLATTLDQGFANTVRLMDGKFGLDQGALIKIRVPKGSKGMYMRNSIFEAFEVELLLQRNTKLKITSIKDTSNGLLIEADIDQSEQLPFIPALKEEKKKSGDTNNPKWIWTPGDFEIKHA